MRHLTFTRLVVWAAGLFVLAGAVFYVLTWPRGLDEARLAGVEAGDATRGETWFWAGGCASCHAAKGAKDAARLELGGGQVLKSAFGDFVVPNISSDDSDGLGNWDGADFANAMQRGIGPEGRHLYPAFPYSSFIHMSDEDIADLWAYMKMLPAVAGRPPETALALPLNIRRGIGLWNLMFLHEGPVIALANDDPVLRRGQYLVEGPGHCGQCHTPRAFGGGLDTNRWLAGAPAAEGEGKVPNITTGEGGIGSWSETDIAYYLETGFTPDYDSVGGAMVEVQENMARLEPGDRDAIAAYLKAIPPQSSGE